MKVSKIYNGLEFAFKRRKYGQCTMYTWAWVKHNDSWLDLGDPWPCINPPRADYLALRAQVAS
jgi:hypothetical protein